MVDRLTGTRALPPIAPPVRPAAEAAPAAPAPVARQMAGDALSLRGRDANAGVAKVDLERIDVSAFEEAGKAEVDAQTARLVANSKNPVIGKMILDYVDGIRNLILGIDQPEEQEKDKKLEEAHKKLKKLMEAAIASGDLNLLVQLRSVLKTIISKMAITDPQVADFKQLQAEVLKAIESIREKSGLLKFHQDTWKQTVARSSAAGGAAPTA
ncbi:hypothetical protein D3C72_385920 [compost metagenome]